MMQEILAIGNAKGARFGRLGLAAVLLLSMGLPHARLAAQENGEEAFDEASLRHRTALHYDPLLEAPLDSLLTLYRGAGRLDELLGLYRSHIAQFAEDVGAKTVLVRLLRRIDRNGAEELIATAAPQHPDFAPLQYVLHQVLDERGDPRAAEVLSRAIELETDPNRRNEWLDQLLQLSEAETTRKLAEAHFARLLASEDQNADSLLAFSRLLQRHQFWETSLTALAKAKASEPAPEAEVEIDFLAATALGQSGKRREAGEMLDALLGRLAPDHWRRRELLSLRMSLIANEAERVALLGKFEAAYRAKPEGETVLLDFVEALVAAERRNEAVQLLLSNAAILPKSGPIETRVLEVLEDAASDADLVRFLEQRLEADPARLDLRFRLVKANYALGRDPVAEQDFKAVVAGLDPEETSARILELQRFLRGIDRIDAAAVYLDRYLRSHPSRLDVARELAEVLVASEDGAGIDALVHRLSPAEAEAANVLDLSEFLLEKGFPQAAGILVAARLEREPRHFELGLLHLRILGKTGDEAGVRRESAALRELTDTSPRYAQWLEAAIEANRDLETLEGFFASEQNRFDFDDGNWTSEKVEKFLLLCEAGKRQLYTAKIAESLRRTLASPGIEAALRLRLREFLVGVIEEDPAAAAETEQQLELLAGEDPAHRLDYDLRRALVYHRSQRSDLAQDLLGKLDLGEVSSVPLLREASDVLVEYGFLREAEVALATINRLDPDDLLSWERRLSVLATLGEESALRGVLRSLRSGEILPGLRELSNQTLDDHLCASYWRSLAGLAAGGDAGLEEMLSLLASVERESLSAEALLWVEWTRAFVLVRLGRSGEGQESLGRFQELAKEHRLDSIRFPDGLSLSVEAATGFLAARTPAPEAEPGPFPGGEFLLGSPRLRWVFETGGAAVARLGLAGTRLVILDESDTVHVVEASSGKLLWREGFGVSREGMGSKPRAFREVSPPALVGGGVDRAARVIEAKAARSFVVADDRFVFIRGNELAAFAVADGAMLWTAALPETASRDLHGRDGARPERVFAVEGGCVVVFDPIRNEGRGFDFGSGRLLWQSRLGGEGADPETPGLNSLNCGVAAGGGHVFIYGRDSVVLDPVTGKVVWRFGEGEPLGFPVVLRLHREGEEIAEGPGVGEPAELAFASNGPVAFHDFSSRGSGAFDGPGFLKGRAALLSPGVHWSRERLLESQPALAVLSADGLWLMQGERVRRISTDLPFFSSDLPAGGVHIGQVDGHVWFLDGDELHHLDFSRKRVSRLSLRDLGDPASLCAMVSGNQLLVRGTTGLKLVNARTGQVLGQGTLPPDLTEHLALLGDGGVPLNSAGSVWQGRIQKGGPGRPASVSPVSDLLVEGRLFANLGHGRIACLEAPPPSRSVAAPAPPEN